METSEGILALFQAAGGLALLYLGAEALIRGAATLALWMRISPLAVGLTIVSFGTSTPELVVSLDAGVAGANDIAVGNIVGSNIANILLILGVSALIRPVAVDSRVVRLDAPLMVLVSMLLIGSLADGRVSRLEGSSFLLGLIGYFGLTFWWARSRQEVGGPDFSVAAREASFTPVVYLLLVILGVLVLIAGGHLLVDAGVELAIALGASQAVIGLTLIAVGTSLPELATSVVAAAKDRGDIAVGNVVGSNLFNILGILGLTASITPLARGEVGWMSLGVMLIAAVALVPLLYTRLKLGRREGVLLLSCYAGYLGWLIAV